MEQWPEGAVGKSVVIFVEVLLLEIDRRRGDALIALKIDMAGKILGGFARPAEPDTAVFAARGGERNSEAAFVAAAFASRWLDPVRHDNQTAQLTELQGLLSKIGKASERARVCKYN